MTEVVYLHNRGKASIALFMLVMFITPIATPLSSADGNTTSRNTPDIRLSNLLLDGGGSVYNATDSTFYVQNATHTINVDVANYGTSPKDVIVFVYHKGSPLSNENLVASEGPFSLAPLQEITVLIQWTASPGIGQELTIKNSVTSNDITMPFNVKSAPKYTDERVTSYDLPSPGGGNTVAAIPSGGYTFSATVLNTGVEDIFASMRLTFTDVTDNSNVETYDSSGSLKLSPGSLKVDPVPGLVEFPFSATPELVTGVWTLKAELVLDTPGPVDKIYSFGDVVDVRFSDYAATLTTPANRSTEPGSSTILNYWRNSVSA